MNRSIQDHNNPALSNEQRLWQAISNALHALQNDDTGSALRILREGFALTPATR